MDELLPFRDRSQIPPHRDDEVLGKIRRIEGDAFWRHQQFRGLILLHADAVGL
jgi:hypothetical protein